MQGAWGGGLQRCSEVLLYLYSKMSPQTLVGEILYRFINFTSALALDNHQPDLISKSVVRCLQYIDGWVRVRG